MYHRAALAHFPQITYVRYRQLREHFLDLEKLWEAELEDLVKAGLEVEIADEFLNWRDANPAEKFAEILEREKIQTVALGDLDYPPLLAQIIDPPFVIFFRGQLPLPPQPALAIVGTRRCSVYGKRVTADFSSGLARQGINIVSGLALGIDGAAHEACLAGGGKTIAVLGSGVDRDHVFPTAHRGLADKIVAGGGAVISEYPPGFKPTSYSFPARNRIIAGLSLGVLVTEAPLGSGALITARASLDYNREVFVIPHSLYSPSGEGNNDLLKSGACLVTKVDDILNELNLQNLRSIVGEKPAVSGLGPVDSRILSALSSESQSVDSVIRATGLDSATVGARLLFLEMKGLVKNLGGMMFVKND